MRADDHCLDVLFRNARSQNAWQDKTIPDAQLHELHELARMGPTCANTNPARFMFVKSPEAKNALANMVTPGNVDKVLSAPVTVIIGYDCKFHEHLPQLFAHNPDMQTMYASDSTLAETTAFRNSSLQGAYLMFAARALGLDCGPMSGFRNAKVDAHFFADSSVKSNFICGIGYGDPSKLFDRLPRLEFDQACRIL